MATSARLDELKKKFDENPRRYFAPLANEYRKLGDLTQAIALCRAHLPNQPGHISGHIVLAQALYEARELGESRQIFEASLDLDPENLIALRYLGDIAREQGEPSHARGWYERVLDADPRNDEIATLLRELDDAATATADGDESRVPAFEDLPQHGNVVLETPSFTPADTFESASSGSHAIDPLVADSGTGTPSWGTAVTESAPVESSASEELLHDLPEAGESLSFFESTSTEDAFVATTESADDDLFFGTSASTGSIESDDATESTSAADDDWFASASAAPEHEGIEELASSDAARFEDSFLPDLAQVTPMDSLVVSEVSDPEAAPTFVDEQSTSFSNDAELDFGDEAAPAAPAQSSIPTPSFLNAIDELPADEPFADAVESSAGASQEFDEFLASAPTPAAPFSFSFDATPAAADASFDAPTIESDVPTAEQDAIVAESEQVVAEEAEEPTLEVDIIAAADENDVAADDDSALAGVSAGFDTGESNEIEQEPSDVEPVGLGGDFVVEYGEFVAPSDDETPFIANSISVPIADEDAVYEAPAIEELELTSAVELAQPFDVEPVEAVASPTVEFEAESVVDFEAQDEFAPSDPVDAVESAAERVEVGSTFDVEEVEEVEEAPIVSEERESWRDAADVAPIEGLISREVDVVPETPVEASVEAGEAEATPAFVTETMAELYLQQGFTDEALAIYRQLLAQQPDDDTLRDRIAAIERGASSTVVDGVSPRDSIDRAGQSVRNFFGHFARRTPSTRSVPPANDVGGAPVAQAQQPVTETEARTAGAANRDEALTVPDEVAAPATLSQLFASGAVSGADEDAASSLASAFGGDDSTPASRIAERELSLEHLFRDVPARSSGAVTLDEFYQSSSPGDSDPSARDAADGEERGADIEQFTAWLEGLKKK